VSSLPQGKIQIKTRDYQYRQSRKFRRLMQAEYIRNWSAVSMANWVLISTEKAAERDVTITNISLILFVISYPHSRENQFAILTYYKK
jgi:hypothetical protein